MLEDLKLARIRSINVVFDAKLEKFYESLGFEMMMAGTIKNLWRISSDYR